MIKIKENSIVYIAAPANIATGGPEALHQLHHSLVELGIKSYMYYLPSNGADPVHDKYKKYNPVWTDNIIDSKENVLIVPEISTKLLSNFSDIRKVIYWLSVDHYFMDIPNIYIRTLSLYNLKANDYFLRHSKSLKRLIKSFIESITSKRRHRHFNKWRKQDQIVHFAQSFFALYFLKKKNVSSDIYLLPEYIHDDFILENSHINFNNRDNIILYNPSKGLEFTIKLISTAPDLTWVPLKDMAQKEVIQLMSHAKIYIDFGNHPGRDRLPREAALLGCCIITGKSGSAKFYEDIPIDEKYKFEEKDENIEKILNCIQDILKDYETIVADFEQYRAIILDEKSEHKKILREIFKM